MARAKRRATRAKTTKSTKTKAKAKAKPKPKAKAKAQPKPKAKAKANPVRRKGAPAKRPPAPTPPPPKPRPTVTPGMEPFLLTESSPGRFSLLLTTFDGAAPAFEQIGIDGGGYAWEGVARHVVAKAPVLGDRIQFDPEASMFCAYSDDRAGLEDLGKRLSALYNDLARLKNVVSVIGPGGFDD